MQRHLLPFPSTLTSTLATALVAALALVACGSDGDPSTGPTSPVSKDEVADLGAADDGVDYCARYGWYDDSVCDTFCPLPDPDCGDDEAARCLALDASSPAPDREACCTSASYPYCAAASPLVSQDGEGPTLCVGIRGNGPRITSHFGGLARLYEHYGLFDGAAGGSSGSISTFLVESVQMNPAVRCAGCSPWEQGARAALLLKSLRGYFGVLAGSDEGNAIQTLLALKAEADERDLQGLLERDPTAGVAAVRDLLGSPDLQALVNPELLALLAESPDPAFHAQDVLDSLANAASFTADDATIFVRPGVIDFAAFARRLARVGSFYAGYAPADPARMARFLDQCGYESRGMTWSEIVALPTAEGETCGALFEGMASDFREALLADEGAYPSRADDRIGAHLPTLVTTGVIEGAAVDTWEAARADYLAAEADFTWDVDFDDVRVGWFGAEDDLARVASNPRGYEDLKTAKHRSLGALTWGEVLSYSPAEPGLARALELPGDAEHGAQVSVGGWSDLQPVLVLRNLGCEKVVYLTRRGGSAGFASDVATLLGMDAEESAALLDLGGESAYTASLEEAAGVWCTDWDAPPVQDLEAMFADGYGAPFETGDPWLQSYDGYPGIVGSTGLPGCTPRVE
ncbi:MAG TPA: hypothetical protein RMH85_29825 [Polyangiaceae bacterium LLY-WYZ-15_(1-7)]|nr:hypothetical protein [Myxococcales bacterium]MBJ71481.1 hypothetical protein [Sandaracinus sp.]HJL03637.1 hypothetical protein [Polyangiaceae bacterium LLY-WYZ-15_(1-7)]HJL12718.1 hypothetical protein [Polyangiaceae bacterium LLY-WYZ-15_(1-7)]HJL35970.1 hypothetical protein [Polyangiaceae bacterium LLY-WYZ-15_(1-7)]